jgi:uncharacterized membrane protein YagU involved in acid resistance
MKAQPIAAIVAGGFTAGVLDIASAIFAWLPRGVSPQRILQSVASGALGADAFQGGWSTALAGLGFHFLIAFTAAAVFYMASRKIDFLTRHPIWSGLAYGEVVYLFMNFAVIPLSAIGKVPGFVIPQSLITGPLGHLVFVGLPISLAVLRYAPRRAGGEVA